MPSALRYQEWHERRLPHWQPPGAQLFVTFRLAGSLPPEARERLHAEGRQPGDRTSERWSVALDDWLDRQAAGPVSLAEPRVAAVLVEAITYRDGRTYDLAAYCVMPNHVHLVFGQLGGPDVAMAPDQIPSIAAIMHSLKRYTALEANRLLHRDGPFWAREYYDHWIRDAEEAERIIAYVVENPVKAGLVDQVKDWPWSYARPRGD